jgi:hypothetical protein
MTKLSFTGSLATKDQLIESIERHDAASPAEAERLFNVPQVLWKLKDSISEGLSVDESKEWPLRFARAIPVGADLSLIWPKFASWLLMDSIRYVRSEKAIQAIQWVADLYENLIRGVPVSRGQWKNARAAAYAAHGADAAYAAAAAYAYTAAHAAAAHAAAATAAAAYAYTTVYVVAAVYTAAAAAYAVCAYTAVYAVAAVYAAAAAAHTAYTAYTYAASVYAAAYAAARKAQSDKLESLLLELSP